MAVAATIQNYLENHGIEYEIIEHPRTDNPKQSARIAHVPPEQMARPVLLGDDINYLLAVVPASHRLDLDRLNQVMARSLELVDGEELEFTFSDCEKGAIPPVGEAYGVDTVLDVALIQQEAIYFEAGDHKYLVRMRGDDFRRLMEHVPRVQVSHHL